MTKSLLLLYDFLAVRGGAERVLMTLYQKFPAHVCVGFAAEDAFGGEIDRKDLINLSADSRFTALKVPKVMGAFYRAEKISRGYSTRVYAGSYSVLAFSPTHQGRSIYYCHTPPRFLYDLREMYAASVMALQRPFLNHLGRWFQPRYEAAVQGMDVVLANSENVRRRLRDYVGVESTVIYPPVETDFFRWGGRGDYFLSTARLEPLKRVDIIIKAFLDMPSHRLIVTSGGSQEKYLRALAKHAPNIQFTGWIGDSQLAGLLGYARATVYVPVDEDFGMSPVESMSAGKPVIGTAEGGLLETVIHGETGILLPKHLRKEDVQAAVESMTLQRAFSMRSSCEEQAKKFSRARFLAELKQVIG